MRFLLCLASLLGSANLNAAYPYAGCFDVASRRHQLPLDLLLAVAAVESNWDADARSNRNAHGIMQIRWPVTARYLGVSRVAELYNPCLNIDLGARYLAELHTRFNGDSYLALAAYNYGPTRLSSRADVPASVRRYVDKVESHRRRIRGTMQASIPAPSTSTVELVRFDSESRAMMFERSLSRQVPGIPLERRTEGRSTVIYLLQGRMSPEMHYRLAALFPNLD